MARRSEPPRPEKRRVVGDRVPRGLVARLMRLRGLDPATLRPALRHHAGEGGDWWTRCWVVVDDLLEITATAGAALRRRGGDPSPSYALVLGKPRHFYELDEGEGSRG